MKPSIDGYNLETETLTLTWIFFFSLLSEFVTDALHNISFTGWFTYSRLKISQWHSRKRERSMGCIKQKARHKH